MLEWHRDPCSRCLVKGNSETSFGNLFDSPQHSHTSNIMAEEPNNAQNMVPVHAENTRALRDYALPTVGNASAIGRPTIAANNFEIKPAIIQMPSD